MAGNSCGAAGNLWPGPTAELKEDAGAKSAACQLGLPARQRTRGQNSAALWGPGLGCEAGPGLGAHQSYSITGASPASGEGGIGQVERAGC
jgi:hypothetical protein